VRSNLSGDRAHERSLWFAGDVRPAREAAGGDDETDEPIAGDAPIVMATGDVSRRSATPS
jgi:hypothetical protein